MESKPEASSFSSFMFGATVAAAIMEVILLIGHHEGQQSAVNLQIYNQQIEQELSAERPAAKIGRLILDEESDRFKFVLNGHSECRGKFEVKDSKAHIVDNVVCTEQNDF